MDNSEGAIGHKRGTMRTIVTALEGIIAALYADNSQCAIGHNSCTMRTIVRALYGIIAALCGQ